ncbi:MAG: FkbM family methyltransferase [Acidobacteriota bacterium]
MLATDSTTDELHQLASDRPLTTVEIHKPNDFYGHATIIKKYCGVPLDYQIKAAIEHGMYLPGRVWSTDLASSLPSVFTISSARFPTLREHSRKHLFALGPILAYASHDLSAQQLVEESNRLGKCLLVFPAHSTHHVDTDFDIHRYCAALEQMGKGFDVIRVCLYWKDILRGLAQPYLQHGFQCVTAGHMFDPLFLPRLKRFIELSSVTTSNQVGTHIGYCIWMKKPHFLTPFNLRRSANDSRMLAECIDPANAPQALTEISAAFVEPQGEITPKQKSLVARYWGFDDHKTPDQLKATLQAAEDLFQRGKPVDNRSHKPPTIRSIDRLIDAVGRIVSSRPRRVPGYLEIEGRPIAFADLHSFYHQARQIFQGRLYDFTPRTDTPVILDCGAHIGLASLFFALRFPQATIRAFEADPEIAQMLKNNVESLSLRQVSAHHCAVWTHDRGIGFKASGDDSGHVKSNGNDLKHHVPTVRLRDLLNQGPIDLLKLDIEGSEHAVINDCDGALRNVEAIVVEVHQFREEDGRLGDVLSALERNNFRYVLGDLHAANWLQSSERIPFSAASTDKYIVTVYAWQSETFRKLPSCVHGLSSENLPQLGKVLDLLNSHRDEAALGALDAAVRANPNLPSLQYGRALALARQGMASQAISVLRDLLALMPNHPKAGLLLQELGPELSCYLNSIDQAIK